MAQTVKSLLTMWENRVRSLGREDPLEKENGNSLQYSCLENPGMEEPGRLHGVTESWT